MKRCNECGKRYLEDLGECPRCAPETADPPQGIVVGKILDVVEYMGRNDGLRDGFQMLDPYSP